MAQKTDAWHGRNLVSIQSALSRLAPRLVKGGPDDSTRA